MSLPNNRSESLVPLVLAITFTAWFWVDPLPWDAWKWALLGFFWVLAALAFWADVSP